MFRFLVAVLASLSVALPGVATASSEHHPHPRPHVNAHMDATVSHPGDGHRERREHKESCEGGGCEVDLAMTCCAAMTGCVSIGVPTAGGEAVGVASPDTAGSPPPFGAAQLLTGQSFEIDPPPPRA